MTQRGRKNGDMLQDSYPEDLDKSQNQRQIRHKWADLGKWTCEDLEVLCPLFILMFLLHSWKF